MIYLTGTRSIVDVLKTLNAEDSRCGKFDKPLDNRYLNDLQVYNLRVKLDRISHLVQSNFKDIQNSKRHEYKNITHEFTRHTTTQYNIKNRKCNLLTANLP